VQILNISMSPCFLKPLPHYLNLSYCAGHVDYHRPITATKTLLALTTNY